MSILDEILEEQGEQVIIPERRPKVDPFAHVYTWAFDEAFARRVVRNENATGGGGKFAPGSLKAEDFGPRGGWAVVGERIAR